MDPLAGLTTMFAAHKFLPWFLFGIAVLLLTLVLGRSFCGWVCPLGVMVDIADRLWAPKNQGKIGRTKLRPLKTWFLVFFVIAAISGVQFVWILDPIPLTWRTFGAVIFPGLTLGLNGFFNLLINLGANWDWLYESYDWFTFTITPLETHVITGWFVVAVMFVIILGLSAISRRFWCRRLCPLGALLGLVAKFSLLQRVVVEDTCTECGLCSKRCKMGAIEDDFETTEKSECILCLNCADDCRKGKTIFTFRKPSRQLSAVDLGRRSAIGTVAGGVGTGVAIHFLDPTVTTSQWLIRPPGAREEAEFLDRCIRCNECVRICSTTGKCLQPLHFEEGVQAFWSPIADYSSGYCEFTCNLCGLVCPTEAIEPIPLEEKKRTKMGVAEIYKEICIPYKDKENCIVCEEHCPTSPKAIEFRPKVAILDDGTERPFLEPFVRTGRCIGCGICEDKCPVEGHKAIRVVRRLEERGRHRGKYLHEDL